ncbi:MAG: cell division protein FtsL [Candidatus Pelagibacter sp.]
MKKLFFYIPVIILIFATTVTKNSTKQLDKKIFNTKENISVMQDKYELLMLEYNYLTSPKKLMEYQKNYFDNELFESDIENLNWIENTNNEVKIKKILSNNE